MAVLSIEKDAEARAEAERRLRAAGLAREELARHQRDEARAEAGLPPIGHGPERDATALRMEGVDVDALIGVKGPSSQAQDMILKAEAKRTPEDTRMAAQEPQAAFDVTAPSPVASPVATDLHEASLKALMGKDNAVPNKVPEHGPKPKITSTDLENKADEGTPVVLRDRVIESNADRAEAQAQNMKEADRAREEKAAKKAARTATAARKEEAAEAPRTATPFDAPFSQTPDATSDTKEK